MADFVFNIAKGRIRELVADHPTQIKILLLKVADTDATMKDTDTITALLATTADEADFTNYGTRQTLANLAATVDDGTDTVEIDCDDVVYTSAGGAANNDIEDAIIFWDPGTGDGNAVPLVCLDAAFTTNGQNVTLQIHADGFWGAS